MRGRERRRHRCQPPRLRRHARDRRERPGPGQWVPNGRPDYLCGCVQASLRRLGIQRIDLWQLHRVDPKVPRDEQFGVIAAMRAAGLIRHVGLSNVSLEELAAAQRFFPVATVQNRYNLVDRGSEAVLDRCAKEGIGFIPWYPLAAGDLAKPGSALADLARKHQATPSQLALAWLLKRSPPCCRSPVRARCGTWRKTSPPHRSRCRTRNFGRSTSRGGRRRRGRRRPPVHPPRQAALIHWPRSGGLAYSKACIARPSLQS